MQARDVSWVSGLSAAVLMLLGACELIGNGSVVEDSSAGAAATGGAPTAAACVNRGQGLYQNYCATCHGQTGRGNGPAAYLLSPAPRDFGSTRFRIVSSVNQVPTDEDLVTVLRRGMPGSAMPPWEWMPDSDLVALARYVRELAITGRADDLQARAIKNDETLERAEALEIATGAMTPKAQIPIPPECEGKPVQLQAGRRFFLENCAKCHGSDGTGSAESPQVNEDGTPAYPRDFTRGVLKGGSSHADIIRRITAGLPGSPMPATSIADPELAASLAAYVRSLIRPGVQERVAQTRRTLVAQRAVGALPWTVQDAGWSQAPEQWVPLMPLWARAHGVEGCTIRALHDGTTLALRISWEDRTQSTELLAQDLFTDAVALQWSRGAQPPLFTMGEPTRPVNIWQWRAGWELDLAAVRGVTALHADTPDDMYGHVDPQSEVLYLTARAAGNPMAAATRTSAGEMLSATGFGTLAPIGADAKLTAKGVWSNGFWDVVMTRPMQACCPGELPLAPGDSVFLGAAAWDGDQRDRNGQKSVSVWHVFRIAD
ncbi:MAG: c-type cytochrome [Planctomycetes bacterium]|nr:c-type cytochrome [Planctomycetota bacterium]